MILGNDGRPIELDRGAMGITYKALDVDLRCPVALKVISDPSQQTALLKYAKAWIAFGCGSENQILIPGVVHHPCLVWGITMRKRFSVNLEVDAKDFKESINTFHQIG